MDKNKKLIVVGTTSKLGNFIFKYPFMAMLILLLIAETVEFMVGAHNLKLLVGTARCFFAYSLNYVFNGK